MSQEQDPYQQPPSTQPSAYGQPSFPPPSSPPPSYGQQPGYGAPPYQAAPKYTPQPPGGTSDDRTWAMVSHIGSFLAAWLALGILAPIVVLIARSGSQFVRHHAYESLNFQLNALAWILLSAVTMIIGIGFILIVLVGIWYLIFVILAGVKANNGEWYRYPFIVRVFNP